VDLYLYKTVVLFQIDKDWVYSIFTMWRYVSAVYALALCLWVCLCGCYKS